MNIHSEKTVQYLPSDQVRDTLGTRMAWVHETGGTLTITDAGTPDGALVPPGLLAEAGLRVVSEQGVREARAHWGAVRSRAVTKGPQGLMHHKNLLAVLVDQTTAAALALRMPVLAFAELELTGFALADGELVAPGEYAAHNGTTLRIRAPQEQENPMDNDSVSPLGPKTPDVIVFEAMRETATRAAAAYMRAAEAATTRQAKEEAIQKMKESWMIKRDRTMSREEMDKVTRRLQAEINSLRDS